MVIKLFIEFPRVLGRTPFVSVQPGDGIEFGIGRHAFLLTKWSIAYNGG